MYLNIIFIIHVYIQCMIVHQWSMYVYKFFKIKVRVERDIKKNHCGFNSIILIKNVHEPYFPDGSLYCLFKWK